MRQKKRVLKSSLKDKKATKEVIEIFPGLYEMPDGSMINTECEPRVAYIRRSDPEQFLHNFMNQVQ